MRLCQRIRVNAFVSSSLSRSLSAAQHVWRPLRLTTWQPQAFKGLSVEHLARRVSRGLPLATPKTTCSCVRQRPLYCCVFLHPDMRHLVYAILFNRQLNGILLVTSNQLALLEAAFPQARKPVPHAVSCISFPSGCPIHYEIHQGIKEKGGTLEFVNLGVVAL